MIVTKERSKGRKDREVGKRGKVKVVWIAGGFCLQVVFFVAS